MRKRIFRWLERLRGQGVGFTGKVLFLSPEKWKDLADCNHGKKVLKRKLTSEFQPSMYFPVIY